MLRLLTIILVLNCISAKAQISGTDTVCAGYLYTFEATIAGADSFAWTLPNWWQEISGGGTSQITVLCNNWLAPICVSGFDSLGNFITQYCHTVNWGGGGIGYSVNLTQVSFCQCPAYTVTVLPDTSGQPCAGCGNGTPSPHLVYGIYHGSSSYANFRGLANGSDLVWTWSSFPDWFYVYLVDTTFGLPNAVQIIGGACPTSINNGFTINCNISYMQLVANPDPVCVGDTFEVSYNYSHGAMSYYNWSSSSNITFYTPNAGTTIGCILNSAGPSWVGVSSEANGCLYAGSAQINYVTCSSAISGDSIVCAGYIYNYSTTMPGAVTYNWTFPSGWYGIIGQGTSSVSASCNVNTGNICVEGFDSNMNSVGTECISTQWGNGGAQGWDIWPDAFYFCPGEPRIINFQIIPNGTGGGACPPGCGSATQSPNLIYGLYENQQFICEIDGSAQSMPPVITTYHAYYVDTTFGADFPDAVVISGGCGTATINNDVTVTMANPGPVQIYQFPDSVCIGDTVLITQPDNMIIATSWSTTGLTVLSNPTPDQLLAIVNSPLADVTYVGVDQWTLCTRTGYHNIQFGTCTAPTAAFVATTNPICPGTCTDFTDQSAGASSFEWIFTGGTPSTSNSENPTGICYTVPGNYDVTLIAANSFGSDTLHIPGYITVYPYPPAQGITQSGDTLFSNQGFDSYRWYHNGNLISGATDYFYVAVLNGDYNLISVDSNGCEVEAVIFNVVTGFENLFGKNLPALVFPNPTVDFIRIEINFDNCRIVIRNAIGQTLLALQTTGSKHIVDVRSLSAGLYYMEIAGQTKQHVRFIKE